MSSLETLLVGHILGSRYRILEPIGRGAMGAVYRALDERLRRPVAVKVISVATATAEARDRLRSRFHREAWATAQLHHPNVASVFDFGTDDDLGMDYLVMELLSGEDLATLIQRCGPFPIPLGLEVLRQAAQGLAAGHRAGLIHRDVKPANLFLVESSGSLRVCVLDFGIALPTGTAETLTHLTQLGSTPLSPAFASPEMHRSDHQLTPASDVFSLGVTAFYMLTGQRPFTAEEISRLTQALPVPVPTMRKYRPEVPTALDALLQRALAPEPGERFPDAAAFLAALSTLEAPTQAAPPAVAGKIATREERVSPSRWSPRARIPRLPIPPAVSRWTLPAAVGLAALGAVAFSGVRMLESQGWSLSESGPVAWERCRAGAESAVEYAPNWKVLARVCNRAIRSGDLGEDARTAALRTRITALKHLERYAEAVADAREWVRLRPTDASAFQALGEVLHRTGQSGEALWAFREALKLEPERAEVRFAAAVALRSMERYKEALEEHRAAARLDPSLLERAGYQQELALVLFYLGRREEALEAHRRVTRLAPEWVDGWGNLGLAAHLVGAHKEAVEAYEEALRREPAYFDARPDHREHWMKSLQRVR
jgi:Flp pilus assembly protein TadD